MEVIIEAETEEEAQEIFDNCNINEEFNPEYVEQVSIDLWDEFINPTQVESTLEVPAENLEKYDFKLFYIAFGNKRPYTFETYKEALIKYEEVCRYYKKSDAFVLEAITIDNTPHTIHYIHDREIKNYSFVPTKK